jgi:asparagine synthase (glutamine-hydrolysing)
VIVHLYEEHGPECVRHLHGMFAFALWDERRAQLLLARDRVGTKPLLYALRGGTVTWASEMAALLEDGEIRRDVDPASVDTYLALGYVPAPSSFLRNVSKLPPAHYLLMRDGRATVHRYWALDYGKKLSEPVTELTERIRSAILDATRRRLVADVPLGAFLSGGIDSSAVVAAMAQLTSEPVRTFSIGFDHEGFDELPHARAVAQQFGTIHEEFRVRADAISVIPRIVRHYGEPFADSSAIPSFYLAEMTRRHVTVALNGDGGDESFGGYQRYVANALAHRTEHVPAALRAAIARLGRCLPEGGAISSPTNRIRRLASGLGQDAATRYAGYVCWFNADQRRDLYQPDFSAELADLDGARELAKRWASTSGASVVDRMLEVDATTYLVEDLIAKIDIATMAHGLEARSPLLDHQLMELAASIPGNLKVRGREKKWILREALRPWLPAAVLDRRKQGFSVPLSTWLRTDLQTWAREILLDPGTARRGYFEPATVRRLLDRHAAGTDADARRIYSLLMLELWHREFIDLNAGASRVAA